MTRLLVLAALGAAMAFTAAAGAQTFPAKPIRVIVPFPAGGVVDVQTRAVTTSMAAELGQPVVVEARPGANSNIGAEAVARAPADGYTLLTGASFFLNNPILETGLRWAPKDFTPIARFALSPSFFVVPVALPVETLQDYAELARRRGNLQYGDGGIGQPQSLAFEMFKAVAGARIDAVGYKGAPPIVPDLINGLVSAAVLPSAVAIPPVKAGKLKALANTGDKRSALLPDVPTVAEAGFADVTFLSWYGLLAPAGTPPEAIARIAESVRRVTATAEVKDRLVNAGGDSAFLAPPEFAQFLREDQARWEKFIKATRKP